MIERRDSVRDHGRRRALFQNRSYGSFLPPAWAAFLFAVFEVFLRRVFLCEALGGTEAAFDGVEHEGAVVFGHFLAAHEGKAVGVREVVTDGVEALLDVALVPRREAASFLRGRGREEVLRGRLL